MARKLFVDIDVLMVPTMPAAVHHCRASRPIRSGPTRGSAPTPTSSTCWISPASPCPSRSPTDGTPFGVTLLAPAGRDAQLASLGAALHARTGLTLGALGIPQPPLAAPLARLRCRRGGRRGGGRASLRHAAQSRAGVCRRAFPGGDRDRRRLSAVRARRCWCRPGPACCALRPEPARAIALETWALSMEAFGRFVAVRAAAAVDRLGQARRRLPGQGLPGRGRGRQRRAQHLELRRLARVRRAQGAAVTGDSPRRPRARNRCARASRRRPRRGRPEGSPPPRARAPHATGRAARRCGTGPG